MSLRRSMFSKFDCASGSIVEARVCFSLFLSFLQLVALASRYSADSVGSGTPLRCSLCIAFLSTEFTEGWGPCVAQEELGASSSEMNFDLSL